MAAGEIALVDSDSATVAIRLSGDWQVRDGMPALAVLEDGMSSRSGVSKVEFDVTELGEWDSVLVTFALQVSDFCASHKLELDRGGLPEGAQRLLGLAETVPEKSDARSAEQKSSFLARVGTAAQNGWGEATGMLAFIGEMTMAVGRLLRGRARFRMVDLGLMLQHSGADALPIITLISLLVGSIFAFVGAVQLEQFGAAIYVADLVGIAMTREMGAMMTAIVMAGRTGAAFAAQLGSMKVNQEIDALETMGISPLDYLVLPRMIALCAMMPLLCLYADFVGILGGAAVGVGMLGIAPSAYAQQTIGAVTYTHLIGGICKASVYGVLVALSGCMRGMQSGSSASAVGDATTAAVVTSIVLVVCASGVFAVLFYALGI